MTIFMFLFCVVLFFLFDWIVFVFEFIHTYIKYVDIAKLKIIKITIEFINFKKF